MTELCVSIEYALITPMILVARIEDAIPCFVNWFDNDEDYFDICIEARVEDMGFVESILAEYVQAGMGLTSPMNQDHTQKGATTAMKKFEEWLYWEGTRYIVMFYLFIVPLFAIFGAKEIALIFAILLLPWYSWAKKYQEEWNKKI